MSDLSNIKELPNPYDFANPVDEPELFFGRAKELEEIKYYLDQATKATHPINLAILGERASGKTSLLNMIKVEARRKGCTVARVNLDEGDASSQLRFFFKMFNAVLTAACGDDAFGGLEGRTFEAYLDVVDTYEIPKDRTFCPFGFPFQYARAMSSNNEDGPVSETRFERDMESIQRELGCPIVLLIDESNVLAESRVHLQKLRNVFMNLRGFMIVLAGTPRMFPVMDDVFSPIVRQFKKINLREFEDLRETEDCVRKPLERLARSHPEAVDLITPSVVSEIHDLTGGNPYEVQLNCHILFRRLQQGRARTMQLSLDALEEMFEEHAQSQDMSTRPTLAAIRSFDSNQLRALAFLCQSSGSATFDQLWKFEYLLRGEERWTKANLEAHLEHFVERGVLGIDNETPTFMGDEFDRIYCKYLARNQRITLLISERPFETLMLGRLEGLLRSLDNESPRLIRVRDRDRLTDVSKVVLDDNEVSDPFEETSEAAADVYWASVDFRGEEAFEVVTLSIELAGSRTAQSYRHSGPDQAREHPLDALPSMLAGVSNRATEIQGSFNVVVETLPVLPIDTLIDRARKSANVQIRNRIIRWHTAAMKEAHFKDHDQPEALFHAQMQTRLEESWTIANNLGYLFLANDQLAEAKEWLHRSRDLADEPAEIALPTYNIGVLEAKEGGLEAASGRFKETIELLKGVGAADRECGCLIVPKFSEGSGALDFDEVIDPNMLDTAELAMSVVEAFSKSR